MGIYYVFECAVDHCTAEFYLNDIPVVMRSQDGGRLFGGQVNELVVDGINEIGAIAKLLYEYCVPSYFGIP